MKYLPDINAKMINGCENNLEKSLLYFIREVQTLDRENRNRIENDKQRIKQIRSLEEKLRLIKNI